MRSYVDQESINAKSTAVLTYQTQLQALGSWAGSKWAKEISMLMRLCVGCVAVCAGPMV